VTIKTFYAGNLPLVLFYFRQVLIQRFLVQLWELKLVQSGAIQETSSHESPGANPISEPVAVHDLNVPYSATEEPYVAPPGDAMVGRVQLLMLLSFILLFHEQWHYFSHSSSSRPPFFSECPYLVVIVLKESY